ncbi:MAG TPA: MGMT family protein [Candidatus Polarisedimenticolia bacterium]|nr:MGMT family protein [Candidatus Polarisedimenticolia bacterium]
MSLAARRDGPFLEEVKRISGGLPVLRDPKAIVAAHREISQYLRGRRTRFTLHADLAGMTPFQRLVLDATARIPHGRVASYGEIARAIGRPGAARAVGQALSVNPVPLVVPCHRVIASNGRLGGFTVGGNPSGVGVKRRLLELERAIPPAPPR